jgi:hypothetical protein
MNTRPPPLGRNPLQEALDNYIQVTEELAQARYDLSEERATNQALSAEVTMLRAAYREADAERIRLTQVASTLHGELKGIQAVINGAVTSAIHAGIQAAERHESRIEAQAEEATLQHAGDEAHELLTKLEEIARPTPAGESQFTVERAPEQRPRSDGTLPPLNQF